MDHVSKKVRSKIMAAIHSRGNTTTELPLERLLRAAGLRGYRKHWPVAGKPDFAWPRRKIAVFVDGCFWHGCPCKYLPRTNVAFWRNKIEANKRRDRRVSRSLRREGWAVIRVKECAVRREWTIKRISKAVSGSGDCSTKANEGQGTKCGDSYAMLHPEKRTR
jgi:DNA mismatch endonuclease, patch repair protein